MNHMSNLHTCNMIDIPNLSSSTSDDSTLETPSSSPPLFDLAKKSRWKKLKKRILHAHRDSEKKKQRKDRSHCDEQDETGLSLLGLALGYHAPLDIIQTILTVDPQQCRIIDMYGANSLHLACLNGASPDSVAHIANHCSDLVDSKDIDQRTPLHHAVECICHDEIDFKSWTQVVDILCRFDCSIIHNSDMNENCPIDIVHIAINRVGESNNIEESKKLAELNRLGKVMRFLRKLSIGVYRLKKKHWEFSKRHSLRATNNQMKAKQVRRRGNKMPVFDDEDEDLKATSTYGMMVCQIN